MRQGVKSYAPQTTKRGSSYLNEAIRHPFGAERKKRGLVFCGIRGGGESMSVLGYVQVKKQDAAANCSLRATEKRHRVSRRVREKKGDDKKRLQVTSIKVDAKRHQSYINFRSRHSAHIGEKKKSIRQSVGGNPGEKEFPAGIFRRLLQSQRKGGGTQQKDSGPRVEDNRVAGGRVRKPLLRVTKEPGSRDKRQFCFGN